MYSTSGNYTLDILFYRKEIEIEKRFEDILTKSKSVAFSLLFSIVTLLTVLVFTRLQKMALTFTGLAPTTARPKQSFYGMTIQI